MMPDYNRIAPYYDRLAGIVFGDRLEKAQKAHLNIIEPHSSVLIVGGGTGAILEYLEERNIIIDVDYVEMSSGMIDRAKNRIYKQVRPKFYQKDILRFKGKNYDFIIINFFFDQYNDQNAKKILNHILMALSQEGAIIFVDFVHSERLLDKWLVTLMYLFFKLTTKLEKVQLLDHNALFGISDLRIIKSKTIGSNIKAEVYKKR